MCHSDTDGQPDNERPSDTNDQSDTESELDHQSNTFSPNSIASPIPNAKLIPNAPRTYFAGPRLSLEQLLSTAVVAMEHRRCAAVLAFQPPENGRRGK